MSLFRSIGARKDATRGTTALEVRKDLAGLFVRAGVLPGAVSPLVAGTAGWAYSVGVAGFVTQRAVGDGFHLFGNDGSVTVGAGGVGTTVSVAPGVGLSRIDIVWVRHRSASENGDTTSEPDFGVTEGTAAASPVAPSIPAGALELARNTMTSSATSTASAGNTITQTGVGTALKGSPVPVRNVTEQSALTALASSSNPIFTVRADATASRRLEVCDDGATWRTVHQAQTPQKGVRASDTTHGIGAWSVAASITAYPFVKDSWYLINGSGSVSTGGATATLLHRVRAFGLEASAEWPVTAVAGTIYPLSGHLLFQAGSTTTVDVAHEVYVPAPATGVVVRAGHAVSVVKVA